jgi:NitT/TauT family transport system substrate-binding protein
MKHIRNLLTRLNIYRLAVFIFAVFLFIYSVNHFVLKDVVRIGKSAWPSWDYFKLATENSRKPSQYRFKFIEYDTYEDTLRAFIDGEVDIATLSIYEAVLAYEELRGDVVVFLLLDYTIGSDAVMAHEYIDGLSELKGRRIGVDPFSVGHYTLLKALEHAHLENSDVRITYGSPDELLSAFQTKQLDAISIYDPYIYKLKQLSPSASVVFSSEEIPRKICDVVFARRSWIERNRTIVSVLRSIWFDQIKKGPSFRGLIKHSDYKDSAYLDHLSSRVYLTGKLENTFGFGTSKKPGYLFTSIQEMAQYLQPFSAQKTPLTIKKSILYTETSP